jgi:hypothetical protein
VGAGRAHLRGQGSADDYHNGIDACRDPTAFPYLHLVLLPRFPALIINTAFYAADICISRIDMKFSSPFPAKEARKQKVKIDVLTIALPL